MPRRAIGSLLFVLMLNVLALGDGLLSVAGLGPGCNDTSRSDAAPMSAMSDMASMDMGAASTGKNSEKAPSPEKGGCNLPWAFGCTAAGPCGPTVAVSVALRGSSYKIRAAAIRAADPQAPESPAVAPELPPPRV